MRWEVAFVTVLTLVTLLSLGCDAPDREACRNACDKIFACDQEFGSQELLNNWAESCRNACDEADEINATAADCINELETNEEDCAKITSQCGSGATESE